MQEGEWIMIDKSVFIADSATISGSVTIGEESSVWYGAVIRAEMEEVKIGKQTNIQDQVVIHIDHKFPTIIGDRVVIGHSAIIHGCQIEEDTLIGMGSIILNGAKIGKQCIIAAGAVVTQNMVIPDGSVVMGNPAQIKRTIRSEEIQHNRENVEEYVRLAKENKIKQQNKKQQSNPVIKAILERRSTRAFIKKEIQREDLQQILQAAIYAPSGMNKQTWQFTAITNKKKIQQLAKLVEKYLNRPGYNFYNPAALILTSNLRDSQWAKEDNACALENIFLAAHSLGIQSVWINQLQTIGDELEVRAYLKEIGIPDEHLIYGIAALGYGESTGDCVVNKKGSIKIIE